MPTGLSVELQAKIDNIKTRQTRIETNLTASKEGVKTALVDSVMKVMDVDDFINNQGYLAYYNEYSHTGGVDPIDLRDRQKIYIESLSKDEQINLLAEYSIDAEREQGHNDWEKELTDAQKAKDVTKKAIAVQAKSVIESFKNLMVEHEKLITELKGKVKTKKAEIKEKDNDLKEIENQITANMKAMQASKNYTPTPDQISEAKNAIAGLNTKKTKLEGERTALQTELTSLETNLNNMEEQRDIYKASIEEAISELEESLKMDGIYVGSYEGLGEKASSEAENEESVNMEAGSTSQGGIDERKPKDIAKAMMADFRNLAPEEIMEMVEHTGYGDLLNMSRELGPINRINLEKVMKNRLQDLENGLEATIKDSNGNDQVIRLALKDLEDLSDLDEAKFNKVMKIMKYYTDNYQTMAVHERQEAERVMNYLKIANLLTESQRGKISRFVGRFTQKGTRINEIGNSLRRFATERGKRESKKWERNQDIRTRLAFKTPIPSTTRKKHIDRSGNNPIKQMDRDY